MKLHWVIRDHDLSGNALGYASHNRAMKKWASQYFEYDETAPISLTIVPADFFAPIPGKINVLFTMWEFLEIPKSYIENINKADALIVPCAFNRDLFRKYTDKPIYVCHEGVDTNVFKFKERTFPSIKAGERFRFLWIGAPNPRKGYPYLINASKVIQDVPGAELYLKTTVQKLNWKQALKAAWKYRNDILFRKTAEGKKVLNSLTRIARRTPKPMLRDRLTVLGKYKNVFFDTRMLPVEELIALYHTAHAFVLPTCGEGWGLTLSEAMATGAPCISVAETGCKEFFNSDVGYPLEYNILKQELANYDLRADAYIPDAADVIKKMVHVMSHYHEAIEKGKKGADLISKKFTWEQSAKRLYEIIKEVSDDHKSRNN